ncbi:bidirectional sugar transporter SWEET16-like isoform X1 [Quercus lobata]|uniref:Bidirectional sugar transporter SWEET n=1 Tax=Quercus lobata TaxID=97700 RepID=A0A7N2R113_QUELO|nr:bidirectional sugar transporter SWEET16-like isoform X1 [Quercus lobata]
MACLSFIIGIIGNITAILLYASPIKTFWWVVKKRSTESYNGIPYICTLLNTCLWTFYGLLKPGGLLLVTVNGVGTILQIIFVTLFLIFAPKDKKIKTVYMVVVLNVAFPLLVIAITHLVIHGASKKLTFVGIISAGISIAMYAAPLSSMKTVIKTKSVEYMPFSLSFCVFLNACVWGIYSMLIKDIFVGVPNVLGFLLGSVQLILYSFYKSKMLEKSTNVIIEEGPTQIVKGVIEIRVNDEVVNPWNEQTKAAC